MVSFWNFFIEKRQFTVLLMLALTAGGLFSVFAIPKESAPEVEIPTGIVSTVLPGAAALDVEKLVTKKIEDEVANISNLNTLTSTSRDGVSTVVAEFEASANLDQAIADLKDAVDRAKPTLPEEATEPQVIRINFADQPVLVVSISGKYGPKTLTDIGSVLEEELKSVPGVAKVTATGVRDPEITVVLRKEALLQYGVSLGSIVAGIKSENAALPIGTITVRGIEYAIRFDGDIEDIATIENVPIGRSGGQTVYVRDVADVYDGLEKATSFSRVSVRGSPAETALTLTVYKKRGGNVLTTSTLVREKLDSLKETVLREGNIVVTFDRGELVQKDLTELSQVGLETVLLVMLALLITIGWRESLVAGLSIPLSFVIAFIGLYASGNTINFVSLFSLILAVGILVDSGIVVTEAIHTRFKRFGDARVAARESLREYALPLTAGTLATVAVFIPLFFLSGITGKFIASIPFTVIFVLVASIFVALGFIPSIAILITKKSMNRMEKFQEEYNDTVREWYKRTLRAFLRNRLVQNLFLAALILGFVGAVSMPLVGLVKIIFFPGGNADFFYIELEEPQGTTLSRTDFSVRAVEELLYEDKDIASFVTTIGAGSTFGGGPGGGGGGGSGSKLANITINLYKDREKTSSEIANEIRKLLDPIQSIEWHVTELQGGPPTGAPILIKFQAENLDDLDRAVTRAERLLSSISGARDVSTSLKDDTAEFVFTIDSGKAHEAGLTPIAIAGILRNAITGTTATTITKGNDDVDVVVKLDLNSSLRDPDTTNAGTIDDIRQIAVETPEGTVLLGSLLEASLTKSNALISRENRTRLATISSYVDESRTALEVSGEFESRLKELNLPEGVSVILSGENEDVDRTFRDMIVALIAGLLLMLGILVLEFNSIRYTLYLLLTVPLSLIGVLSGLAITGAPLSFPSMLGIIALAGIIINHAIILLDSMYHLINDPKGMTLENIVVESAAVRLRPIFLTTVTTVLGMVPLAGASDLWGPLAFSVMFGLSFAMVLTLLLIPLLFYRWPGKRFNGPKSKKSIRGKWKPDLVITLPSQVPHLALPPQ